MDPQPLTWIGKRWLDPLLEAPELRMNVRRGRVLQRKGMVSGLEVRPGLITAAIGSDTGQTWSVKIKWAPLGEDVFKRVVKRIAEEASLAAVLLRGRIDERIADLFLAANHGEAGLFPFSLRERNYAGFCGCRERQPCTHLVAAHFELVRVFEADPLTLVHFRGRDRQSLIDAVRAKREGAASPGGKKKPAASAPGDDLEPAEGLLDGYTQRGVMPHLAFQINETEVPDVDTLPVLRALGPGPGDTAPEEIIEVLRPLLRTGRTRVRTVLEQVGGEATETMPNPVQADRLDDLLVAAAHQHGSLTSGFVAEALGISSREARQYLQWLVEEGRLKQIGRARGTRYEPADA